MLLRIMIHRYDQFDSIGMENIICIVIVSYDSDQIKENYRSDYFDDVCDMLTSHVDHL